MGLVYLINEQDTNNYKIGITRSKTVTHRSKTLQTANPRKLITVKQFKTDYPYRIETMLHSYYFSKRGKGEWFELSDDDVLNFISVCEGFANTLKMLMENNYFYQNSDIK